MEESALKLLGLSQNEILIYQYLVSVSDATVDLISKHTSIHRRNVYDALQRLIERGLIYEVVTRRTHFYSAVDPDKLMEMIEEKRIRLNSVLPQLKKIYELKREEPEAQLYIGDDGFKKLLRDIIATGETFYVVGAKASFFDPRYKEDFEKFLEQARKKNILCTFLADHEVLQMEDTFREAFGDDIKFLPPEYSTNAAILIFGDNTVFEFDAGYAKFDREELLSYRIIDKRLASGYKKWFALMRQICP